jgi:cardiolipin synthase A/B
MSTVKPAFHNWLCTGDAVFPAMLEAIQGAQRTIRFETYIYAPDHVGERFRTALLAARQRGVTVRVLFDALGSYGLPMNYWDSLRAAGGEARWFNPIKLGRLGFRSHRKLLVCDEEVAFIGGFNIAKEYEGDGVKTGWCDLGLQLISPLAADLAVSFDGMFERANFLHKRLMRLRKTSAKKDIMERDGELLLSGPGRGHNPFKRALRTDLARTKRVRIIAAYFLPTWRIRRDLMRIAQRGGKVQLILAGKSDVAISQLACRSLYRRFLKAGVEIYEYQPQILHAKLILIENAVYIGSANLDPRSLSLNYELMVRFQNEELATEAADQFQKNLEYCQRIELEAWRKSRSWWNRLRQRWAYFILARLDPFVARWQYKRMPN